MPAETSVGDALVAVYQAVKAWWVAMALTFTAWRHLSALLLLPLVLALRLVSSPLKYADTRLRAWTHTPKRPLSARHPSGAPSPPARSTEDRLIQQSQAGTLEAENFWKEEEEREELEPLLPHSGSASAETLLLSVPSSDFLTADAAPLTPERLPAATHRRSPSWEENAAGVDALLGISLDMQLPIPEQQTQAPTGAIVSAEQFDNLEGAGQGAAAPASDLEMSHSVQGWPPGPLTVLRADRANTAFSKELAAAAADVVAA